MTAEQVEKYIVDRPFRPFRLTLESGEEITVRNPSKALLSGPSVAVVGISRAKKGAGGVEKLRIVRVEDIASAESVSPGKF
jgi:hypothetical protein